MYNFDKSEILHSSPEKCFDISFFEMTKNYTKETAENLYNIYKNMPISFVVNRSDSIIKEAYYGKAFIENILKSVVLLPTQIDYLKNAVTGIKNESKSLLIPKEQIAKYDEIYNTILRRESEIKGLMEFSKKVNSLRNWSDVAYANDCLSLLIDQLYFAEKNSDKHSFKDFMSNLYDIDEPYVFFQIAPLLLSKYGEMVATIILDKTREFYKNYNRSIIDEQLTKSLQTITALNFIMKDDYIIHALKNCGNYNLYKVWTEIGQKTIADVDCARAKEAMQAVAVESVSPDLAIKFMMEDGFGNDDSKAVADAYKYQSLNHKRVILEFMLESSMASDDENADKAVEHYMQELCDTEAEMLALEWEDNGEPNALIKTQIMTAKEKEREEAEKAAKKKEEKKKEIQDEEVSEVSAEAKEIRKDAIELAEKTVEDLEGDMTCHINSKDRDKFISGAENSICLGGFGNEEKQKKVVDALKEAFEDDENISISDDSYFTVYLNVKKSSEAYCESETSFFIIPDRDSILYEAGEVSTQADKPKDETPKEDEKDSPFDKKDEIKKPKEDFATKLQNKALDHDAKRQEKKAIKDEKNTKLKNAGKAMAAGPKGWVDNVKNFTRKFDKMDDNRRKKFFLTPGYRHRLFKNLKLALIYGGAAQAKLTFVPIVALCRHFSKDKDRRVRNELYRELDTEIKICEEKISDANSNGDQQEKYKLMRIKAKLEAEKNRVGVNSKFI